jgi:hypothetical protein
MATFRPECTCFSIRNRDSTESPDRLLETRIGKTKQVASIEARQVSDTSLSIAQMLGLAEQAIECLHAKAIR